MSFFLPFMCIFALVRTFIIMLNKSSERGHHFLIPSLKGEVISFSPLHYLWAFCRWPLSSWGKSFLFLFFFFFEWFYFERKLGFAKYFLCIYWDDCVLLVLYFINMVSWFSDIKTTLYSWNKFHLAMVHNHFYVLLDLFCEDFVFIFIRDFGL